MYKNGNLFSQGGAAFPIQHENTDCYDGINGITARAYFAIHAPPTPDEYKRLFANEKVLDIEMGWRIAFADAMIKEFCPQ